MLQLVLEQCRSNGMVHDNVHKHRTDKNHNDPSDPTSSLLPSLDNHRNQ